MVGDSGGERGGRQTCSRRQCRQSAHNTRRHVVSDQTGINKEEEIIKQTGLSGTGGRGKGGGGGRNSFSSIFFLLLSWNEINAFVAHKTQDDRIDEEERGARTEGKNEQVKLS